MRWKIAVALETTLAFLAGTLAVATLFWPAWLETVTGWDPDHRSGGAERLVVAGLLALALLAGALARRIWRRHLALAS